MVTTTLLFTGAGCQQCHSGQTNEVKAAFHKAGLPHLASEAVAAWARHPAVLRYVKRPPPRLPGPTSGVAALGIAAAHHNPPPR